MWLIAGNAARVFHARRAPFCGADDQGVVQGPVLPQVPDSRLPQAPQRRDPAKLVLLGVIGAALLGVVALFLVLAKFGAPAPVPQATCLRGSAAGW